MQQQRKEGVHLTKNLLWQLRKLNSNWIQNQSACVELSYWVFKNTEEKGLPGSTSVWHAIRFGHWPACSLRWRYDGRIGTRRWLCALYESFLWRPLMRRVDTMCEILQMGAHTLCWCGGRFSLWVLSQINTALFLVYILFVCNFLNSVNILCAFCVNYSPPRFRNICASN